MNVITVAEALARVLKETDVSKYAIAKELGVQPIQIDNWLTGKTKTMRREVYGKLLHTYQSPISVIFINERKG